MNIKNFLDNLTKNLMIIFNTTIKNINYLLLGFIICYLLYLNICVYKNKSSCPGRFNQIRYNTNTLHLHHWLIHLLLLPFSYFIKNNKLKYFYIGIQLGGIFHGIFTYKDWYLILK